MFFQPVLMTDISIIIPARNEEENIAELLTRIHTTLSKHNLNYEVILIDDYSDDRTAEVIQELQPNYPVIFERNKGRAGKAGSLLQGFGLAHAPLLAILDADLQYPPEAIPPMLTVIKEGADLVIAERANRHPQLFHQLGTRIYAHIFGRWLHRLPYDIHSGLKVFKREIVERLSLNPKPWSFDLEFLIKARQANYVVQSLPVPYRARTSASRRKSNRTMIASWQLASAGVYHKWAPPEVVPFSAAYEKIHGKGFDYNGKRFVTHNDLDPSLSALYRLNRWHIAYILGMVLFIVIGLLLDWRTTLTSIVALLTILYFADLLFNLFLILKSFLKESQIKISDEEIAQVPDSEWPRYTIFCPLYKEHEVIPQFVAAMSQLDYPPEKLQIMLLLEEDDTVTVSKARSMDLPANFEIVVVPDSLPKTKPKACNYGLTKATGEYVVIYDAEDIPEPLQLKKAFLAFRKKGSRTICIQAKLNFYNPHQNLLTRLFTAEYSLWFDLVLTGIQSVNAPIPLGGTSNHFRVADLFKLRGWDAFNVTEDCDLGMRLVKKGYRTAILDSTTLEEANSDFKNWFWQRSRWIKGYIQSYFVHMRDFFDFMYDWRQPHGFTFQLIVGGKVLSMLINPIMWLIIIAYFLMRAQVGEFIDSFFPAPVFYMGTISLIFGNFLYLYYYMVGCAKRGQEELIKFSLFVPFYWLAMSAAAYMAIYKLITAPHHWSKTKHGLHLNNKKAVAQANQRIKPRASTTQPADKSAWKKLDLDF